MNGQKIKLGYKVRDKVTGFVGIAENRTTFLYGCDRYCVQPEVDQEGRLPDSLMIDEPQLEVINSELSMPPGNEAESQFKLGQVVIDKISKTIGTITGRAVYINGCARLLIEPKKKGHVHWWIDEEQVEPKKTIFGRLKFTTHIDKMATTGGPARSNSKY